MHRFSWIPKKPSKRSSLAPVRRTCFLSTSAAREQEEDVVGATTSELTRTGVRAFLEGQIEASSGNKSNSTTLIRSAVHRMRVAALRLELARRNMETSGTKKDLVPRLLSVLPPARQMRKRSRPVGTASSVDSLFAPSSDVSTKESPPQPYSSTKSLLGSELAIDPDRSYVLQVKGLSALSLEGAGVGMVLFDPCDEGVRWEARVFLCRKRTLLEAEYSAIIVALQHVAKHGVRRVVLETDSDVLQKQLVEDFRVTRQSLRLMYWTIMNLKEQSLRDMTVHLVSRHDIDRAHDLALKALATGKSVNVSGIVDPMSEEKVDPAVSSNVICSDYPTHKSSVASEDTRPENIDPHATYRLQFDGGARSYPNGVSGAGMVLFDKNGQEVWCGWKYLDSMSNNAAEYCALLLGLRCARSLGIRSLVVEGDSDLVIKQLNGEYEVRHPIMRLLYGPTKEAMGEFDSIHLQHVFRKDNKRADWLANHAMDTKSSHGFAELDDDLPIAL